MKAVGIIPARYGSTRFPGKPLANINGKTMIRRVYEQAQKATSLSELIVATDDERIEKEVLSFGGRVMLTSPDHGSGTERCAEVVEKLGRDYHVAVNIQGDEPFIDPAIIDLLVRMFLNPEVDIATLASKITTEPELDNPNVVKVIRGVQNKALYFSRLPIPFQRGQNLGERINNHTYLKHIGIYAYRTDVLKNIVRLEVSPLEKAESLEQLRWLENNFTIYLSVTETESLAVDTPDDLSKIINI